MKLFLLLTFFVMLMQSCTKDPFKVECRTPQSYYYTLTNGALKQTPYFTNPAFDTISFASDKGDTLTFVKTKTDTTWYDEQGDGSPDCGYDKNYYQTLHNTYATIKGVGSFDVRHSLKNASWPSFGSNTVTITFNSIILEMYDRWIDDKTYKTYIETFDTGSKIYKNSILIYPSNGGSNTGLAYINKEFGFYYLIDSFNSLKWQITK